MTKPNGDSADKAVSPKSALFLCAESPYPVVGGGPLRSASLLEYLGRHFTVDAIVFRQPGDPHPGATFPLGKVRRLFTVELPFHTKTKQARFVRNAHRLLRGSPPLYDRFSGFGSKIEALLSGAAYDLGVIEHFWCAPYWAQLRPRCRYLVLDLHNIESIWHDRLAAASGPIGSLAHQRFAASYRSLECSLLPKFDELLVTSPEDAVTIQPSSGDAAITVYPNALPLMPAPARSDQPVIVFSGNLEYQPNIEAVRFFASQVWPRIRLRAPGVIWELIGKNPMAVAHLVNGDRRIRLTGPVEDAIATIANAQIAVVPLHAGSGTRVKILEAWAASTPVVSTSIGAEGLCARDGEHLLISDDAHRFADSVCALLDSPPERARIGRNGRLLFERSYTWDKAWNNLHWVHETKRRIPHHRED